MDKTQLPTNLRQNIIAGIAREERHFAKVYLLKSSIIFVASLVGVLLSLLYLLTNLKQTGFYQYLSVLLSEGDAFLYWRELSYSIVGAVPVIGMIVFLTALGFFVWSLIKTIASAKRLTLLIN